MRSRGSRTAASSSTAAADIGIGSVSLSFSFARDVSGSKVVRVWLWVVSASVVVHAD